MLSGFLPSLREVEINPGKSRDILPGFLPSLRDVEINPGMSQDKLIGFLSPLCDIEINPDRISVIDQSHHPILLPGVSCAPSAIDRDCTTISASMSVPRCSRTVILSFAAIVREGS